MDGLVTRSQDDQNRRILIMETQRELVMLESDSRKMKVRKELLELELRRVGAEKQKLRMLEDEKRNELKRIDNDYRILQEDITHIKKKMGTL